MYWNFVAIDGVIKNQNKSRLNHISDRQAWMCSLVIGLRRSSHKIPVSLKDRMSFVSAWHIIMAVLQIKCVDQFVNDVNSTLRQRQDHERLKGIIARIESYDVVVSSDICLINSNLLCLYWLLRCTVRTSNIVALPVLNYSMPSNRSVSLLTAM
jgi:hypothetical protein